MAYQDNTVGYNTAPLSCSPHHIVVFDSVFLRHTASNTRTRASNQLQCQLSPKKNPKGEWLIYTSINKWTVT